MRRASYRAGPLVWVAILVASLTLLVLCQKILWLVIPFLFGLIGYYLVAPVHQRLILAGLGRRLAAVVVCGAGFLVGCVIGVGVLPALGGSLTNWQATATRYTEGGLRFVVDSLVWIEAHFPVAARAHLADKLVQQVSEISSHLASDYLTTGAMTIAAWLPSLMLAPVLTFFFLCDGRAFKMFLSRAVPNAFFERALCLLEDVDKTARLYFVGLMKLTLLDAVCLSTGLWLLGISAPLALGVVTAILAWVPFVGSILGCLIVVLVAATDFPGVPTMAYGAIGLFVIVRLLDDFIFLPMTIGRSLRLHPLLTILMIFIGGAVAGITGLMLALPLLGIVMVLGEAAGALLTDRRLRARHAFARELERREVTHDLC